MAKLTEAQIISAAENFVEINNRTPTYDELRRSLGQGSASTLNKYYRAWRKQKDAELLTQNTTPHVDLLPIPESITQSLAVTWSQAVAAVKADAEKEVDAIKGLVRTEKEKFLSEITERDDIITSLETENSELQDAVESLKADMVARTAELEARSNELATQTGRIQELEKQLVLATESIANERKRSDSSQSELACLKAQMTMLEEQLPKHTSNH